MWVVQLPALLCCYMLTWGAGADQGPCSGPGMVCSCTSLVLVPCRVSGVYGGLSHTGHHSQPPVPASNNLSTSSYTTSLLEARAVNMAHITLVIQSTSIKFTGNNTKLRKKRTNRRYISEQKIENFSFIKV